MAHGSEGMPDLALAVAGVADFLGQLAAHRYLQINGRETEIRRDLMELPE